jgi:chemotaxis-related protein WspD
MSDRTDLAAGSSSGAVIDDCWNRIGVRGDHSCPELQEHAHCRNCPIQRAVAAELLAHAVPDDYAAVWTELVSRPVQQTDRDTASSVIFRVGTEWLALPAAAIQEVATLRPVHRVPHRTSGVLLGVVNVRGELIISVSIARLLGLEHATTPTPSAAAAAAAASAAATAADRGRPGAAAAHPRLLVIRRKDLRAACPVDDVHGVHRYAPAALSGVPSTLAKAGTRYSRALLSWRDQTVGVLDEELLFAALRRGMA